MQKDFPINAKRVLRESITEKGIKVQKASSRDG